MRYFKLYDEDNHLLGIGTGLDGIEISKEEYDNLLIEIAEKTIYSEDVYLNNINIEDVPEKYRYDVEWEVNKLKEMNNFLEEQEQEEVE